MDNIPDWISALCAIGSLIVAIVAMVKANNLSSQVQTLTSQLNQLSSSIKDSKLKQENKSGSGNSFVGGNYTK